MCRRELASTLASAVARMPLIRLQEFVEALPREYREGAPRRKTPYRDEAERLRAIARSAIARMNDDELTQLNLDTGVATPDAVAT